MLNNIKLIVFDLDGTLVSSHKNIYLATLKAFDELKIDAEIEEKEFFKNIGLHFKEIFQNLMIRVVDIDKFISIYKEFYFDFINESKIYPSVESTLLILKKKGYKISLLTTKGEDQAVKIINYLGLGKYFDLITGRKKGFKIKPHPEPLLNICEHFDIAPEQTLIVGDTELDIRCGKSANAYTCGVTFGYRTIEQIKEEKPDFIIDKFNKLTEILK